MNVVSLGIVSVATPGTPVSIGNVMATVQGTNVGPFNVTSSNKYLSLSINAGVTSQVITLTTGGSRSASQVATDINNAVTGMTAYAANGRVVINSNATGSSASIFVQNIDSNAYTLLGFLYPETYYGSADTRVTKIRITPLKGNQGDLYIGNVPNFDKTTGNGLIDRLMKPLATPSTLDTFYVETHENMNSLHTAQYFIDADNADDGAMVSVWID
jgi:hypothetical protein